MSSVATPACRGSYCFTETASWALVTGRVTKSWAVLTNRACSACTLAIEFHEPPKLAQCTFTHPSIGPKAASTAGIARGQPRRAAVVAYRTLSACTLGTKICEPPRLAKRACIHTSVGSAARLAWVACCGTPPITGASSGALSATCQTMNTTVTPFRTRTATTQSGKCCRRASQTCCASRGTCFTSEAPLRARLARFLPILCAIRAFATKSTDAKSDILRIGSWGALRACSRPYVASKEPGIAMLALHHSHAVFGGSTRARMARTATRHGSIQALRALIASSSKH